MSLLVNQEEEEKKKGLGGLLGNLDSQSLLAFAAALQEQAAPSTTPQGGLRLAAPMLAYKQANEQQKQKQALNQLFTDRGIPSDLPTDVAIKLLNNNKPTTPKFQTFQNTSDSPININGQEIQPNGTFNFDANKLYDPRNQAVSDAYGKGIIKPYKDKNQNQQVSLKNYTNTSNEDIKLSSGIVIKSGQTTGLNVSDVFSDPSRAETRTLINNGALRESNKIDIKSKTYLNNTGKTLELKNGTKVGAGDSINLNNAQQIQNKEFIDKNELGLFEGGRATNKTILQDPDTGDRYEQYTINGREYVRDLKKGERLPLPVFRKLNSDLFPKLRSLTTTEIAERSSKRSKLDDKQKDIVTEFNSLQALARYGSSVDKAGGGINFTIDSFLRDVETILDSENLTQEQLAAGLTKGQQEALLGKYRVEVVGGGVMTEQDALRVINALGRRGALRNKQEMRIFLNQMFRDKYNRYERAVKFFNTTIKDQQDDAFMPFPEFENYKNMMKELTTIAEDEQFNTDLDSDEWG